MIRIAFIVVLVALASAGLSTADEQRVLGVMGMNPVTGGSCVAVYVPLAEGEALVGVEWYNNDDTVAFPEILVSGGTAEDPGWTTDALGVRADVFGGESAWSTIQWPGSYRSDGGGVYVLFRLPLASVFLREGSGGGAGIGYQAAGRGLAGWLSVDGVDWIALQRAYGLAVRPIVIPADGGTTVLNLMDKRLPSASATASEKEQSSPLLTTLSPPSPNPFNPRTRLRFTLSEAEHVELSILDLRGRLVRRLADTMFTDTMFSAGEHVLSWHGKDAIGRDVGGGIYLVRFESGQLVQTQRLTLVR